MAGGNPTSKMAQRRAADGATGQGSHLVYSRVPLKIEVAAGTCMAADEESSTGAPGRHRRAVTAQARRSSGSSWTSSGEEAVPGAE